MGLNYNVQKVNLETVGGEGGPMQQASALQKVETPYITAVAVQQPRNLDTVVANLDREAAHAGSDFYYAWSQGGGEVAGVSHSGAVAIARQWGNCAVPAPTVRDLPDGTIEIEASFLDLQAGFTITRPFRFKPAEVPGKFAGKEDQIDRWNNMQFQVGVSKAIRNVVKSGIPGWLVSRVVDKARDAVQLDINVDGIEATAKQGAQEIARLIGYPADAVRKAIISKVGAPLEQFTMSDVEDLKTAYASIKKSDEPAMMAATIYPLLGKAVVDADPAPTVDDIINQTPPTEPKNSSPRDITNYEGMTSNEVAEAPEQPVERPAGDPVACKMCGSELFGASEQFECPKCGRLACVGCDPAWADRGSKNCPDCLAKRKGEE